MQEEVGNKNLNGSSLVGEISSRKENMMKMKKQKLILLKLSTSM